VIFTCHHCNQQYETKPSRASATHYCSISCRAVAQSNPSTFICQHCKQPYKKQPSLHGKTKFCSNKCRAAAHKRPEIRCKGCRLLFTPTRDAQVYCTPTCRKKNFGKTRMHRVTKWCKRSGCGKPMDVQWSRRNRKNYCSVACRAADRRIRKKPTPEQLQHLVIYMTYAQIAQLYGVCAGTVMNWARTYKIRSPVKKKPPNGPKRPSISGYVGEAYGV
jgi:hypothetical protein